MSNITNATFDGSRRKAITCPLFQYDYGQILKISGVELPVSYQVQFSNTEDGGISKTMLGDADGVQIPDEYLLTGDYIYAFIFLHEGEDDGETEYVIEIPVIRRPVPSEETPTPAEQSLINQLLAQLNEGVEAAEESEAAAAASESSAAASAATATAAAATATQKANLAENSATAAAASESSATASAATATAAAATATTKANLAADSATTAAQAADEITEAAEQIATNTADISHLKSDLSEIEKEIKDHRGLSDEAKQALLDCFEKVAWTDVYGRNYYNALELALYDDFPKIDAEFNSGANDIYTDDSLDSLKQYIRLTYYATVQDEGTVLADTDYALRGRLIEGRSVLIAEYGTVEGVVVIADVKQLNYLSGVFIGEGSEAMNIGVVSSGTGSGRVRYYTSGSGMVGFALNTGDHSPIESGANQPRTEVAYPIPVPAEAKKIVVIMPSDEYKLKIIPCRWATTETISTPYWIDAVYGAGYSGNWINQGKAEVDIESFNSGSLYAAFTVSKNELNIATEDTSKWYFGWV